MKKQTSERQVELHLKERVTRLGGLCLKWVSPGQRGVPDRIVLLPRGRIAFVEVKNSVGATSKLQKWMLAKLRAMGFLAAIVHDWEEIDALLREMDTHEI